MLSLCKLLSTSRRQLCTSFEMFEGVCANSLTLCGSEGIDTLSGLAQLPAQPAKLSSTALALITKALFSFFMLLLHLRQQGVNGF